MAGPAERRRLLAQQTGDRGDEEDIARRFATGREQELAAALDQAGIEIGVGKSRTDHQA
jgi:hypothetical protein